MFTNMIFTVKMDMSTNKVMTIFILLTHHFQLRSNNLVQSQILHGEHYKLYQSLLDILFEQQQYQTSKKKKGKGKKEMR